MPPRTAPEWKIIAKYFIRVVIISYLLMRFIIYGTRVLAYYFLHGVWKFF